MARGDATLIEPMHEDRSAGTSTDYNHLRTVGNIWDSLHLKHQLRESNLTLERVYAMLAVFLIELRLHEEQDKIAQIVTGSSSSVKASMYNEYINASKGKVPTKGKANRVMAKAPSPNGD